MKLIEANLFIEFPEMVDLGVPERTIKAWDFTIKYANDKRVTLIPFESLTDKYKKLVHDQYGDPYEYYAKNPILNLIRKDYKAEEFFENFKLPDGRILEQQHIVTYTKDASWLNMIIRVTRDKKTFKAEVRGISMEKFWSTVCELIQADKQSSLPATRRNLITRLAQYKGGSYQSLISPKFCNKNSAKIGKTENGFDEQLASDQVAAIRKLLSAHQNLDNAQVANLANVLFLKNGWLPVSPATVLNIRAKYSHLITAGNSGVRVHRNEVAKQVQRTAPTYPLAMVTVDGWTVELLYQERIEKDGKTSVNYDGRLVVVVVLDPFLKYPIGYAIGERENTELIREANRNAIKHIYELFNEVHRPWQVQSDRYGLKQLTPFYQAMAHLFTPAAVGNAKSKVIEPYFKYLNKQYCQLDTYWSGFNINSNKKNQPNTEYINKIKHDMPEKAEVYAKIERIIALERAKKLPEYAQRWNELTDDNRCKMQVDQYLQLFGKQTLRPIHQLSGDLRPQIAGQQYHFESFDPAFGALNHLAWNIHYDSENMAQVLAVSENNKYRFVLNQKLAIPMAIRDQQPEHFEYRNRVRAYNKELEAEIVQTYADDAATLQKMIDRTPLSLDDHQEAALKLMFTTGGQQKEGLQDAKGLGASAKDRKSGSRKDKSTPDAEWQAEQTEYLKSKIDFNQYLD